MACAPTLGKQRFLNARWALSACLMAREGLIGRDARRALQVIHELAMRSSVEYQWNNGLSEDYSALGSSGFSHHGIAFTTAHMDMLVDAVFSLGTRW